MVFYHSNRNETNQHITVIFAKDQDHGKCICAGMYLCIDVHVEVKGQPQVLFLRNNISYISSHSLA